MALPRRVAGLVQANANGCVLLSSLMKTKYCYPDGHGHALIEFLNYVGDKPFMMILKEVK